MAKISWTSFDLCLWGKSMGFHEGIQNNMPMATDTFPECDERPCHDWASCCMMDWPALFFVSFLMTDWHYHHTPGQNCHCLNLSMYIDSLFFIGMGGEFLLAFLPSQDFCSFQQVSRRCFTLVSLNACTLVSPPLHTFPFGLPFSYFSLMGFPSSFSSYGKTLPIAIFLSFQTPDSLGGWLPWRIYASLISSHNV